MQQDTWIKYYSKPKSKGSIAIVGSPGLRSIGSLVVDSLIKKLGSNLVAELYSTHFPLIYQTKPSYAANPKFPGIAGINIVAGKAKFPTVQFFWSTSPPLIITRGCHANFEGQYEVAETVLDYFIKAQVRKIIVVAGYGLKGKKVCCAATSHKIMEELKENYGIEAGYYGPFYGFSGVVFGMAMLREMEAFCLFGKTQPTPEDPESPDEEAAQNVLNQLFSILRLDGIE
jgi:proteasome assembly chaperone (PAC2) family protein